MKRERNHRVEAGFVQAGLTKGQSALAFRSAADLEIGDWLPKPTTSQVPRKDVRLREGWSAGLETCATNGYLSISEFKPIY